MNNKPLPITQHIRYGLTPLPFGTLLPSVATSYMLGTLSPIADYGRQKEKIIKNLKSGDKYGRILF